jgi:spermidine synthase
MAQLLRVAGLLFGSGLCALVYQTAWLRELRLVFGCSTAASAAVLAVFMGGLGAGGVWLGKRASKHARPLALYGRLELFIALTAAVTPALVTLASKLYVGVGGTPTLGLSGGTIVRLLLALLLLAVPTFLMGGTLPAAAEAVETEGDTGRRRLALLYGMNTLGAVTGVMLSTFVLIERLGTRGTLWAASALNVVVALLALFFASREPARTVAAESLPAAPAAAPRDPAGENVTPIAPRFALWAAAVSGFAFLLMELVWYRMLAPILGGSTFTFGLILAMALLGIGLGGIAYGLIGKRGATMQGFAVTCALEALCLAAPFAAGDQLALLTNRFHLEAGANFLAHVEGWAAIAGIVVFPASFVAGVQFPLLIALLGRGKDDVGRHIGLAYAWNTVGAIVGSLAGGFGVLPILSAPGTWRAVVAALVALGLVAAVLARGAPLLWRTIPAAAALGALALLASPGPGAPWRHGGIGVGRGPEKPGVETEDWLRRQRRALLWETDGVESSVGVEAWDGIAFVVNGKVDGNARSDASMQVMSGLTGALLFPREIESALVIGLGTGSTAGWLAKVPSIKNVDVVELEPAVLRVAKECAAVNQDVLHNPKASIFIGDAREVLLTTPKRYDLVFSEPSNPYRAGIASLFTREFYEASVGRLSEDGILVQWLQTYEVDDETVRTVYATLTSVFPHVESWLANTSDLLMIASKKPIALDADKLRKRMAGAPYKDALAQVWRVDDLEGFFAHRLGGDKLAAKMAALAEGKLNTDDRTRIEFGFARAVAASNQFNTDSVRDLAIELGEAEPPLAGFDWKKVPERMLAMFAVEGGREEETLLEGAEGDEGARMRALQAWAAGDLGGALAQWKSQAQTAPGDLPEAEMLAEALAEGGSEDALPHIARVRADLPAEADAFLARLRFRQQKLPEAGEALEAAFKRARIDPWPIGAVLSRAIELGNEIAKVDDDQGERIYNALAEPFAVRVVDEDRLVARLNLAVEVDAGRLCAPALAALGPEVPWNIEMLTARAKCLQAIGDEGLQHAMQELASVGGGR